MCEIPVIAGRACAAAATGSRKSKERKQRIFRVLLKALTKITDLPAAKTACLRNGISSA